MNSDDDIKRIFKAQYLLSETARFESSADLSGKANFGRHVFVDREGGISEVVRLNTLDDRQREEIIGFHFAQTYAEYRYGDQSEQPQFYVVDRDNPWDFEYVLHDGTTFFLEICRIADRDLLKALKAENDVTRLLQKRQLRGFEVQKVERLFPGTLSAELVSQITTKADRRRLFDIEGENRCPSLFLRPPMQPRLQLVNEIRTALAKKAAKNHSGKEQTIIVLDNLTTHSEPRNFSDAVNELSEYIDGLPFAAIWLYTGYYSDDNGYNCEYSVIPIKLSDRDREGLERSLRNQQEQGPHD